MSSTIPSICDAVAIIGDKWSPRIIHVLSHGVGTFCAIERELGINPRTLSHRLDILTTSRVITQDTTGVYTLTPRGADLLPILRSMARWSERYSHTSTH